MRHRFGLLAGGVIALVVMAATAAAAAGPGKLPVARYHVSGYGVFHASWIEEWKAVPCQVGGKGGGLDGTLRQLTTIKWETVRPATVLVTRYPSLKGVPPLPPNFSLVPGRSVVGRGIVATATVTQADSGHRDDITCNADGTPKSTPDTPPMECGTHTYRSGYVAGLVWPTVPGVPGQRFAFGLSELGPTQEQSRKDWDRCFGPNVTSYQHIDVINGALPFAHLPHKVRGKLTAIAHGHKVTADYTSQQGGSLGGTLHLHSEYSATHYVTWVRTG
jgi:hypothetical protein